ALSCNRFRSSEPDTLKLRPATPGLKEPGSQSAAFRDDAGIAVPLPRCHSPACRTSAVLRFGSYPRKSSHSHLRRTGGGGTGLLASASQPPIVRPAKALCPAQSLACSIASGTLPSQTLTAPRRAPSETPRLEREDQLR